jgi:hypothetical protein
MRKTCCSANAVWISADSACADSSECPNGFSTTMRESNASSSQSLIANPMMQ